MNLPLLASATGRGGTSREAVAATAPLTYAAAVAEARSSALGWVTLAAGVSGAVAAHLVGYALAFPADATRSQVLADTGHGYFSLVTWVAASVAAVAFARVALAGAAQQGQSARPSPVPRFRCLLASQVAMLLATEVLERLASGDSLGGLVHSRGIAVSLVVQVVVAALFVLLLAGTARLGAALGWRRRCPSAIRPRRGVRPARAAARRCLVTSSGRPRAPPRRPLPSTLQPAR